MLAQLPTNLASPQRLLLAAWKLTWWRPSVVATQARLRSTTVAVAVERFRQRHHRWPENLAELSPALLERVPADPYDGKPIRYRKLDDGVVIYTVGPDGADNGGKIGKDRRYRSIPASTDVGVRLWDVNQRRQPAGSADGK